MLMSARRNIWQAGGHACETVIVSYTLFHVNCQRSYLQSQHRGVHIGRLRRSRLEKEIRFGIAWDVAQAIAHDTSCEQVNEAWAMYRLCGAIKALLQSHEASP